VAQLGGTSVAGARASRCITIVLPMWRQWWSDSRVLLCIAAGLLAFVVQSGELGSSDTTHRLQATHSFWTSEPPVFPDDYPEFGVHGRGGRLYGWFGMGQSLLMLPSDIVGTWVEKLPVFDDYNGNDPSVRDIVVSYSTNILVNVLTVLICLRFLGLLGFTTGQAIAGVLALLVCTTHLHYTQNMMENNYIMLLTLTGFAFQGELALTGRKKALVIGSTALGLNLLTRLTTGLELLAVWLFFQYVCVGGCEGVSQVESLAAPKLSMGDAVPRRVPGAFDYAGEIDFSV